MEWGKGGAGGAGVRWGHLIGSRGGPWGRGARSHNVGALGGAMEAGVHGGHGVKGHRGRVERGKGGASGAAERAGPLKSFRGIGPGVHGAMGPGATQSIGLEAWRHWGPYAKSHGARVEGHGGRVERGMHLIGSMGPEPPK